MVPAKPRYPSPSQDFPSLPSALGNKDRHVGGRTEYPAHSSLFFHMAHIIKTVPQRRSTAAVTSLPVGTLGWCQRMRARRTSNASNRKRNIVAPGRISCRRRSTDQTRAFLLWITSAKSITIPQTLQRSSISLPGFRTPRQQSRGIKDECQL